MSIKSTIVPFKQGTEEWAAHRARSLNASDLAAAMGLSPYLSRAELVARLATGIAPEIDAATQRRFDRGHEVEALARPLAEEIIGEELYAMVYSADVDDLDRPLSASLDGCTLGNELTWEHKQANAELVSSLKAGIIPYQYHPQMEQGLMLTGAERCLFTASNGTAETAVHVWYESNPELREKIIPTWKQLLVDVDNYVPPEPAAVVVAEQVQALPAVMLNVSGQITVRDNFKVFETAMRDFLEHRLIRKPETDQDFADLDAQIKMMKAAEEALDASEAQMLAQISEVDTAKKAKDMLHDMVRKNRLMAEKLLEAEKQRRREEIVRGGRDAFDAHIRSLNDRLGTPYLSTASRSVADPDFAGAIKGKRNLDSMQDAVDTLLANSKIEANAVADRITANLKAIEQANAPTLFADKAALVLKATDDLAAIIANRLAAEQQRQEAERERIRQEEAAKLAREAEAKAQAEAARIKAEAEELARKELEAKNKADQEAQAAEAKRIQAENDHAAAHRTSLVPMASHEITEAQPPQQVIQKPAMSVKSHPIHGLSCTPEYRAWQAMRKRCTNPEHARWSDYGGRGITVCDRWLNDVAAFVEDMGAKPSDDHELDRIDNDAGYSPENCRWVLRSENNRNKSNNRIIEWGGEAKTMAEWCEITGLLFSTLKTRIDVLGWSVDRALTEGVTARGVVANVSPIGGSMGAGQATAVAPAGIKCDGNHGGPRCADSECWNDLPENPWAGCTGLITTAVLSARLGIESLRAAEIESLGFTPVKQPKPGTYWHEHQTQAIGFALMERIRKNVTTDQKAKAA